MRKMKKLLSVLVAATMTLAMAAPSFAAAPTEGSVSIDKPVDGQEYVAYKLFDLSLSEDGKNYAYTISGDSEWKSEFFTEVGDTITSKVDGLTFTKASTGGVYVVTVNEEIFTEAKAADLAKTLSAAVDGKTGTTLNVAGSTLPLGYYFVTSTTGTLCSLDTTHPDVKIQEKNQAPTIKKELTESARDAVAQIGKILDYKVTIDVKPGVENYIFHDHMSTGLEFTGVDDVKVTLGTTNITNDVIIRLDDHEKCPYAHPAEGEDAKDCAFEVDFSQYALEAGNQIVIEYKAKVTKDAVQTDLVTNEAKLSYGEKNDIYTTDGDDNKVTTKTYKFDLVKTDDKNNVLQGAQFKLYDADGAEVKVIKEGDYYRVAEDNETGVLIDAGQATIKGLDDTTYYLEEETAPAGYNKLTERKPVTTVEVNGQNDAVVTEGVFDTTANKGVQVVNKTGTTLPSTGGIGTTIFYAAGIILMAGAVFFVVRRKRA